MKGWSVCRNRLNFLNYVFQLSMSTIFYFQFQVNLIPKANFQHFSSLLNELFGGHKDHISSLLVLYIKPQNIIEQNTELKGKKMDSCSC